jgi:hypothetical protein
LNTDLAHLGARIRVSVTTTRSTKGKQKLETDEINPYRNIIYQPISERWIVWDDGRALSLPSLREAMYVRDEVETRVRRGTRSRNRNYEKAIL